MAHILILEPDRTLARCLKEECIKRQLSVQITANAHEAIVQADIKKPDAVVTELSLAGHSGSEFMYEFRTYIDWLDVPLFVFSSMRVSDAIQSSRDWRLLGITDFVYKPDVTLKELVNRIQASMLL